MNISAECGVHELDQFTVVRLDMRPASKYDMTGDPENPIIAKFLCTIELGSSSAGISGMCCSFSIDMNTAKLD